MNPSGLGQAFGASSLVVIWNKSFCVVSPLAFFLTSTGISLTTNGPYNSISLQRYSTWTNTENLPQDCVLCLRALWAFTEALSSHCLSFSSSMLLKFVPRLQVFTNDFSLVFIYEFFNIVTNILLTWVIFPPCGLFLQRHTNMWTSHCIRKNNRIYIALVNHKTKT